MEQWKEVKDWEGKYAVSDQGRVLSLRKDWRMLKPVIRSGYPSVTLWSNNIYQHYTIHRLVMDTFDENPLKLREVDHVYGDKMDPRLINLERVSSSENKKRAYKLGLADRKGEKHHMAKLTNESVLEIFNSSLTSSQLSKVFKVSAEEIQAIKRGERWAHITGKVYENKNVRRLTEKEVITIYNSNGSYRELAKIFGVAHSVVQTIKTGKSHCHITNTLK